MICDDLNLKMRNSLTNFTTPKSESIDNFGGTLSPAILQSIIEYTTKPGGTVVTFNAHFGAIFLAGENCGRMVFGTESYPYFKAHASDRVTELVGVLVPELEQELDRQKSIPEKRKKKKPFVRPNTCEFSTVCLC